MNIRRSLAAVLLTLPLLLSACGKSAQKEIVIPPGTTVMGARSAVLESLVFLGLSPVTVRPGALLSVYASIYLSDGVVVQVRAAMTGVDAQLKLQALPTEEHIDDLYALLEEFGAVLHVDVIDLLNRSDDRAKTLDAYSIGLQNITERSRRRADDVKQQIAIVKTEQQESRKAVSALDREVKAAVKAKDFASAQEKQQELLEAQTALTKVQFQQQELTAVQETFTELLDIADKRLAALNGNREVLIAGLRVVDVPGVDDLGVIQGRSTGGSRSRRGGITPFGGL